MRNSVIKMRMVTLAGVILLTAGAAAARMSDPHNHEKTSEHKQGKHEQHQASNDGSHGGHMGDMHAKMEKMRELMTKISATKDHKKKRELMQQHMKMMKSQMKKMHSMMGDMHQKCEMMADGKKDGMKCEKCQEKMGGSMKKCPMMGHSKKKDGMMKMMLEMMEQMHTNHSMCAGHGSK